jgi:hypothetical protein
MSAVLAETPPLGVQAVLARRLAGAPWQLAFAPWTQADAMHWRAVLARRADGAAAVLADRAEDAMLRQRIESLLRAPVTWVACDAADIDELLGDLVEQGRAKPIIARVEAAPEPVAGFADPLAISFPTAHSAADLRQVAGDFAGILKQHGGEWIGYLLNRIGTMLIAEVGKTKAEDARRHMDETYLGFMMVRETLATESMRQWMRVVDDLFATQAGQVSDAPNLLVAQSLEMMGTLDLRESLAFNSAVDTLVDCIPPQTMVQVEMRLSDLLDANIDGHNDPIRPDKLGTLVAGVIFQHWDTATSARPIINDALKQSATLLLPLYEAWNASLEQVV